MEARRRVFLLGAGGLAALGTGLAALGSGPARAAAGAGPAAYPFSLGVASGSPLPHAVVLWTRILYHPLDGAAMPPLAMPVRWEVAHDQAFSRLAAKGVASATPALAHSVHVDVGGLEPGRWYWYRFMLGDAVSPVGRTRTAPAPDSLPGALKLAVASCQHWEFGAYAAHRHIAAAAPDLVAFLGDYIYEWGPYQLRHPASAVRTAESFSLAEYRTRYAQYKSDPHLQAAHLAAPWIVTWDDHEVANDYGNDRDERLSADFPQRRAAAYQAFYEHMPVRLSLPDRRGFAHMRIYQRYDWGRLARLHVLDDRQYRSHHACPKAGMGGSNSVGPRDCAALRETGRGMLGAAQQAWLEEGLRTSPARWNILAQQTLMAQASQVPVARDGDGRFWTDGWDGYPMARQRLFDALQSSRAANPLVLSGDVHTFYAAELRRDPLRPPSARNPVLATEFCGTSITSPSRPQARTEQYVAMNPHIQYGRSDKRGFMLLEVTPARTTTLFQGLADVHDANSALATVASFSVRDGQPGPRQS
ncbi:MULTISPECIES: alkaline phosphatase D family protein [unclassified Janthinobacterium]|uniref:alkaline phosphatase D family protein n=1 Tax=unclassified Janthinobacterium TaxID=2610881 RepID=UPI000347315E|nr:MULTISPECIES: alkaline phosphatase D family protein [unclassified Janthinobacterium]MEC5164176.1 alkaline phosphatase D [Janthinobacterium sp. CG_S6]